MPTKRRTRPPMFEDPMAFPLLVVLVTAVVILGVLQYWLLLAIGSALYLGFQVWRRWGENPAARPRRAARPKASRARHRPKKRRR